MIAKNKKQLYIELIADVKKDYENNKQAHKNKNIEMDWYNECKEINLWTYWQGLGYAEKAPDIEIMLVGQDWGNPFINPSQTVQNAIEINKLSMEHYEQIQYLDGIDMNRRDAITDANLVTLFNEIGFKDIDKNRYSQLFFTNFVLGYRNGSASGNMTWQLMKQDAGFFVRLYEILQPKKIICLGQKTYESVIYALEGLKPKIHGYNQFLDGVNYKKIDYQGVKSTVYAVAHCGWLGTNNRGGMGKQIVDWKRIYKK